MSRNWVFLRLIRTKLWRLREQTRLPRIIQPAVHIHMWLHEKPFHEFVWGNACEVTFGGDVAVLLYCRTEHVRSLRLSEEADGKGGACRTRQREMQTKTHPERWARTLALCISVIFIMGFAFFTFMTGCKKCIQLNYIFHVSLYHSFCSPHKPASLAQ